MSLEYNSICTLFHIRSDGNRKNRNHNRRTNARWVAGKIESTSVKSEKGSRRETTGKVNPNLPREIDRSLRNAIILATGLKQIVTRWRNDVHIRRLNRSEISFSSSGWLCRWQIDVVTCYTLSPGCQNIFTNYSWVMYCLAISRTLHSPRTIRRYMYENQRYTNVTLGAFLDFTIFSPAKLDNFHLDDSVTSNRSSPQLNVCRSFIDGQLSL